MSPSISSATERPDDASGNAPQALAIIRRRWPRVGVALERTAVSHTCRWVTGGRVETLEADGFRLASIWDPHSEARLQCQHVDTTAMDITLFGIGMGYLPELLLQRLPTGGRLRVVPMNLSILKALLAHIDMSDWLAHPQLELSLSDDITTLPPDSRLVVNTPMLSLAEPAAEPLRDRLRQVLEGRHVSRYQDRLSPVLDHNIRGNRPHSLRDRSVGTLFPEQGDALDGATCIVAGAGPSLDASLPAIAESVEHGACLVAVDAALLPLVQAGIIPHFVVSIDPLPGVARFYDTELSRLSGCAMVYFPSVDPDVIARWPHERFIAVSTHERYTRYPELDGVARLFSSGSVIHPATDLAVRLGARTVCFAGADFGFPAIDSIASTPQAVPDKGLRASHASGVAGAATVTEENCIFLRDDNDEPMSSQPNLVSYLRDLEAYIAHRSGDGTLFCKLGKYGAAIAGAPPISEEP